MAWTNHIGSISYEEYTVEIETFSPPGCCRIEAHKKDMLPGRTLYLLAFLFVRCHSFPVDLKT